MFAYNGEKDRLELCLGQVHLPVQPGMQIPKMDEGSPATQTGQPYSKTSHAPLSSDHTFSGAIQQKDTSHSRVAFSGQGRSLVSPSTNSASGQTLGSESKTSETRSSLSMQPPTLQAESRDASVAETITEISFEETKANSTAVTSTLTTMKDRTQTEILDIEMKSPEEVALSPTSQVDYAVPEKSEGPEQMDTGTTCTSTPISEGKQSGEGRSLENNSQSVAAEEHSAVDGEEKMDTEMSGSERTVVIQSSNPDSSRPSIIENNQFVPEVKMEHSVHDNGKEDSVTFKSSYSGIATGGPRAVVCTTDQSSSGQKVDSTIPTEKEDTVSGNAKTQSGEFAATPNREGVTSIVGLETADTTQSETTALGAVGSTSKLNTTVADVKTSSVVADSATLASFDKAEPLDEGKYSEGQKFRSCDPPSEQKGTGDNEIEEKPSV